MKNRDPRIGSRITDLHYVSENLKFGTPERVLVTDLGKSAIQIFHDFSISFLNFVFLQNSKKIY